MTDKQLEKEIRAIYRRASVETSEKLEKYMRSFEKLKKSKQLEVANGTMTQDEFNKWYRNKTLIGQRWEAMRDEIAGDMLKSDELARQAIQGKLAVTMADGINRGLFEASKAGKLSADLVLYDKNAVLRLIKHKPSLLPQLKPESATERDIREGKIIRWNQQHITAEVTQGILQGESVPKVASRMQNVADMEQRASIRNARTALGSAHNAGKVEGYKEAEAMGIELEQMWVAIYDERTRHEHRMLDGQRREVGEPFEIDGYEIMYPCDPTAEPEMVYNCRCRLVAITAGMKAVNPDYYKREDQLEVEEQEYQDWKERMSKKAEGSSEKPIEKPIEELKKEGLELYSLFIEGDMHTIHQYAGVDAMGGYIFDEKTIDEEKMKALDSIFEPAQKEITVYKGIAMEEDDIKNLNTYYNHTLSSTTIDKSVAMDYADRALDMDYGEFYPVYETVKIEKGVPIADARKLLGTEGMKEYEKELTVGRNVEWVYDKPVKHENEYGDVFYTVNVTVRKKKR